MGRRVLLGELGICFIFFSILRKETSVLICKLKIWNQYEEETRYVGKQDNE